MQARYALTSSQPVPVKAPSSTLSLHYGRGTEQECVTAGQRRRPAPRLFVRAFFGTNARCSCLYSTIRAEILGVAWAHFHGCGDIIAGRHSSSWPAAAKRRTCDVLYEYVTLTTFQNDPSKSQRRHVRTVWWVQSKTCPPRLELLARRRENSCVRCTV